MSAAVEWLEPWRPVNPEAAERSALEAELRREVSRRHVLFGESARLIARRDDTDDALFELPNGRVAEVHLTWRMAVEPDPVWPITEIFNSLDDWVRESMVPLHKELQEIEREELSKKK